MQYRVKFTAGPLQGQYLLVTASDPIEAASIVGRALGEHAMDTSHAIPHEVGPDDLFGTPPSVPTITIERAIDVLNGHV